VISRRGVLGLGAVTLAGLVGCSSSTSGGKSPGGGGGNGRAADPDAAVLAEAIADTRELIARYDNAPASVPKKIIALRADHLAHLAALGATATASPSPSTTVGSGEPSAKPTANALAALGTAEKAAAERRVDQCQRARSADLARLLASIGGCEAAHASLLDALGGAS
jgi:hypothetical protein